MKVLIGSLDKFDCLYSKKKMFSDEKWKVLNQSLGWANTEPCTPFTYDSDLSLLKSESTAASSNRSDQFETN